MQNYQQQLNEKQQRLTELLAPFSAPALEVFSSPAEHYRMRAEFRVWHDGDDLYHIMFDQASKKPYRVDQFTPACKVINELMAHTIPLLKDTNVLRKKLFQIDYLSGMNEETVISLLYHQQLADDWVQAAKEFQAELRKTHKVHVIGRARKQKIILDQDFIIEKLKVENRTYTFKHTENGFTQPNAFVNIKMIEWAKHCAKGLSGDLLELYCGAGNFSLPLANNFSHVIGTEIAKSSVAAAQFAISANDIQNVDIVRLSAEEFVQALRGERDFNRLQDIDLTTFNFNTVLVDPPRAGLDEQTLQQVSGFDNIIYISCNPATLADNLAYLNKTHTLTKAALFDQFPFTHHIESGVLLTRKVDSTD